MTLMPVRWKVREYLQAHNITPYRLMKTSGLSQGTAYRLAHNSFNSVNAEIIDSVIRALRELTGEDVQVSDLLEYEHRS